MWKAEADTSYRCHTEVTHSQMEVFNFQVPYSYRETWTRAHPFWEFCTLFNRPEQCWDLGAHSAASLPYQNFTQDLWYKVHYSPRWPFQKLLQELITSVHNYICSQRCWSQHGSGTNAPYTFSYIYQLIFSNRIKRVKRKFAERSREKESSMLKWLTLICDTKAQGCCLSSLQQLMGGKGENLAFRSFVLNCNSKTCWNQLEVFLCTDDIYRIWKVIFHLISIIYRSLNTSVCSAGEYLPLPDYRKYFTHVCERSWN